MTTIVLAEDHQVVRQALRLLLEAEGDFQVVGEAADGLQALELVGKVKPEVLVADIILPGLSGIEVTREVKRKWPDVKVVVLSMHANEAYVVKALRHGALGYVVKESGASDLIRAIRSASKGKRYLSPPLSEKSVESYMEKVQEETRDLYDTLTRRERLILQLSAEGHTCADIAERLSISRRTVETHRANMLRKLRLRGQTAVVRFALQRGVVTLDAIRNRPARKRRKAAAAPAKAKAAKAPRKGAKRAAARKK